MTDSLGSIVHTVETSESGMTRREWELGERVAELETELSERIERERIRELELASQRHELEVRFAYNAMLEERVLDHQQQIEFLHRHIDAESQRFNDERQRGAAELTAEREHVAAAQREVAEIRLEMEAVERSRDDVQRELDAERRRFSYRVVQRVATRLKKHRLLSAVLRRASRVVTG